VGIDLKQARIRVKGEQHFQHRKSGKGMKGVGMGGWGVQEEGEGGQETKKRCCYITVDPEMYAL
jgi:hypothetical protein